MGIGRWWIIVLLLNLSVSIDGLEDILVLNDFWLFDRTDVGNWRLLVMLSQAIIINSNNGILRSWTLQHFSDHRFHLFFVGHRPNIKWSYSHVFCFRICLIVNLIISLYFYVSKPSVPPLYFWFHQALGISLWLIPFLKNVLITSLSWLLWSLLLMLLGILLLVVASIAIETNRILSLFCLTKRLTSCVAITVGPIILSTPSSKFI